MQKSKLLKKRYRIPLIIIGILLILRLILPYIVKKYVNNVLADIPGYYGHVEDIDIALIRGAYVIKGLYLNKINAGSQVPFLEFEKTDISIQWKSVFKGKIVSEIIMTRPKITYIFEDHQENTKTPAKAEDWSKALTSMVPISINHLKITNGKIGFVELAADPDIDLYLDNFNLNATNLRNVVQKERTLPSAFSANAISIGNGKLRIDGKMNLVKQIPDADIAFSLEGVSAAALNDYTNHYAKIDFEEGVFNLYSEIAIADGYLKGYIKPMLKNARIVEKDAGFLKTLWEGFVGFFKFVLKNQRTDTLATKVPLEGDLKNIDTKILPVIGNIFKNAWIKAFKNIVDDDIDFEDAAKAAGTGKK